jgi:hypothetical protein
MAFYVFVCDRFKPGAVPRKVGQAKRIKASKKNSFLFSLELNKHDVKEKVCQLLGE